MIQKEYHGFLYQYDKIGGFHIVPHVDIKRPAIFHKYYALTDYNVEALTNMYLYATHPNQLNDPLDCAEELLKFDNIDVIRIFWDSLYPSFLSFCHGNEGVVKELTQKAYKTYLYMKWGVLSLSTNCLDIPMWSAYTKHEGFCVELDLSDLPHRTVGPYPVNYIDKLESISINEKSMQLATIMQTNIKDECWKHEKEWRLLLECPSDFYMEPFGYWATQLKRSCPDYHNRKFKYPLRCLKSVCLGKDFFKGIHSVITTYEDEYVTNNKIKNEVLSFLALSKIPTYVIKKENLEVVKSPIEIIPIRNNVYHICSL